MKIVYVLCMLCMVSIVSAQSLPNNMTDAEKESLRNYHYPTNSLRDNNPPPTPVRTMAEWEQCQGIVIKWMSFTPILTEIVRYASQEGLVFVLCSDSTTVKSALTTASIPTTNIRYIKAVNSGSQNSIWARDYGPWAVYSGVSDSLKLIDWIYNRPRPGDDTNSVSIGTFLNVPVYRTLNAPNDLVNTGGNFMVDGHGTAFASKLIMTDNGAGNSFGVTVKTEAQINSIVNSYMGIGLNRYIKMETLPFDEIHHIDMHIKLIDEETLLVSQYPAGVADGPQIEANLQYILANYQTCYGKPYKIVRIVAPPAANGTYPNSGGDYRTYTNSLIINKTVLVPTYASQYDTTALRIYREAMPGYKVYGINCNTIIPSLGAIHCITKEIGVYEPVYIAHSGIRTSIPNIVNQIKAYIKTRSGVASARLYWRTDTVSAYNQVNMAVTPGDTFTANIPAQPIGTKMYYYISATSVSGKTVEKPLTAPQGYYKFNYENATGVGNNNTIVSSYSLQQNYPNPFNPETTIKYSVPAKSFVTLKVYDMLGKEVANLVNDSREPGEYSVNFNASGIASGVYYYKLISGDYSAVKVMTLIK